MRARPIPLPIVAAMLACAAGAGCASGAPPEPGAVAVGPHYDRIAPHRVMFGEGYRPLWATPIRVPTLDLEREAGGLTPVDRVGSMQTFGLALEGADGRSYTFRSVDKDPSRLLPRWLRVPPLTWIYRDQTAAGLPAAALVTRPLAEALGVLEPEVRLVRLPDDAALGSFRPTFAGRIGLLHEYPSAKPEGGTFGAVEIVSTAELFERFSARGVDRPDARAYLRARLLDLWIGDWDRHPEQMRWARIPGQRGWQPLPEDRDGAFARYEGLVLDTIRPLTERLVRFDDEYPSDAGLFLQSRNLDAWVLAGLGRDDWEREIAFVTSRLDERTIDIAIASLPSPWIEEVGPWLRETLLARREGLSEEALRLYARLAAEPKWLASEARERVEGACDERGGLALELLGPASATSQGPDAAARGAPVLSRRFAPDETRVVELWLAGDGDAVGVENVERCGVELLVHRLASGDGYPAMDRGVPRWD